MSSKLDQTLDAIMNERKPVPSARRRAARKAATKAKASSNGITKKDIGRAQGARAQAKALSKRNAGPSGNGGSKIAVSGLPEDSDQAQIKEYFVKVAGPVKDVIVNYLPNGRSRGSATVTFFQSTSAAKAVASTDGTKVDGKVIKIEVMVGAKNVDKLPVPKSLAERIIKPKGTAKDNKSKPGNKAASKTARDANKKKAGRTAKPTKTAEDLDAEMADYFGYSANGNGATAGGDTMDQVE